MRPLSFLLMPPAPVVRDAGQGMPEARIAVFVMFEPIVITLESARSPSPLFIPTGPNHRRAIAKGGTR